MGSLGRPFANEKIGDKIVYFGYGSNMWRDQMHRRCLESEFIGVGRLHSWRWIINERGYATIVPSEEDDVVYGLLYEITQLNMDELDKYESHYDKVLMDIEDPTAESDETRRIFHDTLVYVERKTNEGPPKTEYIYRMNQAIADAVKEGVPQDYIDQYLRKFIPAEPPSLPN
ncbi:Butirosin biosynthesis, BtrG-like protein [Amanita muscaria]